MVQIVPTFVLGFGEYSVVKQMRHLVGYCLEGAARTAEQQATGCLFRRNQPMSIDQYSAAYQALMDLRSRLQAQTDPAVWEHAKYAGFMAELRRDHVTLVDRALAALPEPDELPTAADIERATMATTTGSQPRERIHP